MRFATPILAALALALAACSTTSTVQQPRPAAPVAGERFSVSFVNRAGTEGGDPSGLEAAIRTRMQAAGVLASGGGATPVEVVLLDYRMRSGGARFWAGAMAGRDRIRSRVRVGDGGSFEIETTNVTAWGTTGGLMERHADEIIARLQGG